MEHGHNDKNSQHHHHYILPTKTAVTVGVALLILTGITVAVAHIDLGRLNFVVAIAIAALKASLVALWFMNLKHDKAENGVIFGTSFLFLAIFIVLTGTDLFFRGDVYVTGPLLAPVSKSHFKKPWVSQPELLAHGREIFNQQCVTCHGPNGHGDGPASAALNPKPRNFTSADNWKNGRKPTDVFQTVTKGLNAMPSFASMPPDDRWSAVHYVLSLGPTPPQPTAADYAKLGIDPTKETVGGGAEEKSIPIELAIDRLAVDGPNGGK